LNVPFKCSSDCRKTYFKSIIKKYNKDLDRNSLQYILNRFDEFEHGWLQVSAKNIYNLPTAYICKKMIWRVFGGEATWSLPNLNMKICGIMYVV
jgi:hypothetical protein